MPRSHDVSTVGSLTKSGYLYEGNYKEWYDRMAGTFDILGHGPECMHIMDYFIGHPRQDKLHKSTRNNTIRRILLQNISPNLLVRVPESDCNNAMRLHIALVRRARFSRLFCLPPEVREIIYEIALTQDPDAERYLNKESCQELFYPPLLYTSSRLRREALPIFYSESDFRHDLPGYQEADHTVALIRWAKLVDNLNLRQLRRFTFVYTVDRGDLKLHVTITYTHNKGLQVNFSGQCQVPSSLKESLVKHVSGIEGTRVALGLEGEAIVMALTCAPWVRDNDEFYTTVRAQPGCECNGCDYHTVVRQHVTDSTS